MPLASYNPGSPSGMDQWSIENTLAPLAVGGSQSEAQMMLGNYQNERQAANSQYASNLDQEHLFAYQQLAQQMREAYLKEVPNYAKEGLLPVLAGTNPGALAGSDPAALQLAQQQWETAAGAKNFQAGATGLNQASQGGYQVNPNVVPGVAGSTVGPYRGPALAQAATIRGQYGLAAANAKGGGEPKVTIGQPMPSTAGGDPQQWSIRVPFSQAQGYADQLDAHAQGRRADRGGNATSLAPAPGNTTAAPASGGGAQRLDTNSPMGQSAQQAATTSSAAWAKDPARQADAADIRKGMQGNTFVTHINPGGIVTARGASGRDIPVGRVTGQQ